MQNFEKFYFNENIEYLEENFLGDLKRAFTKNIFKKRYHGLDLKKFKNRIFEINSRTYQELIDKLSREAVNSIEKRYEIAKEKSKDFEIKGKGNLSLLRPGMLTSLFDSKSSFITNAYVGEIDKGLELIEGSPITSMVYQINNGGFIFFVATEDEEKNNRYFIGSSKRGNDYFIEKLGKSIQQIVTENPPGKEKSKSSIKNSEKIYDNIKRQSEIIIGYNKEEKKKEKKEEIKPETEFGYIDIEPVDYDFIINYWNTEESFKRKLIKKDYRKENHKGYKYINIENKEIEVYIFKFTDIDKAQIVFNSRETKAWADKIGMLDFWKAKEDKSGKLKKYSSMKTYWTKENLI